MDYAAKINGRDAELEHMTEEFNNFMHRVNEVDGIVKKLSSDDQQLQQIGMSEADRLLKCKDEVEFADLDEDTLRLVVKSSRTLVNRKALQKEEPQDEGTMSQEAFMAQVSKDADRRHRDRKIREERADTFKTQATKAFRRGEYAKALSLYDKAIEQVKGSSMLYTNRSLCQMHLNRLDKAIEDADKALYWNEDSLKARLLLAKYYFMDNQMRDFRLEVKACKIKHPKQVQFIEEFVAALKSGGQKGKGEDSEESEESET